MGSAAWGSGVSAHAQSSSDFEQPPVSYSATTPRGQSELEAKLKSAALSLAADERGALKALLAALDVPEESQMLVFSKTSLQRRRINPERPRALYFSDSVYVGWVPGGLAEIIMIDPQLGPVFYAFDLRAAQRGTPKLERDGDCLRCHGGTFVRDIPGVFARSLFTNEEGEPLLRHGTVLVDDATPFNQRWGGWYVTGYHGTEPHRGNVLSSEKGDALVFEAFTQHSDTLTKFIDPTDYLRGTSDVVALLVFEHQMTVQNSFTRANFACRRMMAYQRGLQDAYKEPVTEDPVYDSVKSVFASTAQDVVDRMLFLNAAPLPHGVIGDDAFQKRFAHGAPASASGHTLKELQLWDRLFEQRCSYLIYSPMFLELPETLKTRIFERLQSALRSRDPQDRYAYLPAAEKQRIYDILVETHPDAKRLWQPAAGS